MKKEIDLESRIEALKEELAAAVQREDALLGLNGGSSRLKRILGRTRIGRLAADPDSKIGKIVRLPRTIFRIVTNPSIIKDIKSEKNNNTEKYVADNNNDNDRSLFVPIEFFFCDYNETRINLVLDELNPELVGIATKIANDNNAELRIITYSESVNPLKYNEIVKKNKLKKAEKISFYSSVDQKSKRKVFQLEVGKNDIFITKAWNNKNER